MVTTRQGQSTTTRSKKAPVGNIDQDHFPDINKYSRTGKVGNNFNREICQDSAQYELKEYEQLKTQASEDDDNEDYSDVEEDCVGTDHVTYDCGMKAVIEDGDNELHMQMNKVIKDMKEEKNLARKTYNTFCEKIGTMDNHNVLQETVRRTTRKQAWKNFKLLEEEDYHYNSTFALFIFESLGINMETVTDSVQRQELWLKFKKYVSEGMQAARSSATQAIKKQFIGKLLNLL
jgi:CRISPR/Cas system CMR-associated protein Cmr5 small subunit